MNEKRTPTGLEKYRSSHFTQPLIKAALLTKHSLSNLITMITNS